MVRTVAIDIEQTVLSVLFKANAVEIFAFEKLTVRERVSTF